MGHIKRLNMAIKRFLKLVENYKVLTILFKETIASKILTFAELKVQEP